MSGNFAFIQHFPANSEKFAVILEAWPSISSGQLWTNNSTNVQFTCENNFCESEQNSDNFVEKISVEEWNETVSKYIFEFRREILDAGSVEIYFRFGRLDQSGSNELKLIIPGMMADQEHGSIASDQARDSLKFFQHEP